MTEQAPVEPVAPVQPVVPPQQPPANQPSNDVDVNAMIANIEAETQRQQAELRTQIMTEAETKFAAKLNEQKANSDAVMNAMKSQLDALTKASEEQKRTVIEDYKVKLAQQSQQLQNLEGEMGRRQTNIPAQTNPYRQAPAQDPNGETLDPNVQSAELAKMYNAISGKDF